MLTAKYLVYFPTTFPWEREKEMSAPWKDVCVAGWQEYKGSM